MDHDAGARSAAAAVDAAIPGRWSIDTRKPLSRHAAKNPGAVRRGGKSLGDTRHGQPVRQT